MPKINDLDKWRVEIALSEEYRKNNFGTYKQNLHEFVGANIDYFERGFEFLQSTQPNTTFHSEVLATLNIIHMIVKNIVPAVW